MSKNKFTWWIIGMLFALVLGVGVTNGQVHAEGDLHVSVSPMRESIVLAPGDTYKGSFKVSNPGVSENNLKYDVLVLPFSVDENHKPVFRDEAMSQLAKWITINTPESGVVKPNSVDVVEFTIEVPKDAPAGGQYACIKARTTLAPGEASGINIGEGFGICHVVLAEITGNTTHSGEIAEAGVQSFMFSGDIAGTSLVKNTGNVHALATYTLEVWSAFSGEEVYSNANEPETHYVLPGRSFFNETAWEETPGVGDFRARYTVGFQGFTTTVERVVIICPWWALFIVMMLIAILVIRIMTLLKIKRIEDKSQV